MSLGTSEELSFVWVDSSAFEDLVFIGSFRLGSNAGSSSTFVCA